MDSLVWVPARAQTGFGPPENPLRDPLSGFCDADVKIPPSMVGVKRKIQDVVLASQILLFLRRYSQIFSRTAANLCGIRAITKPSATFHTIHFPATVQRYNFPLWRTAKLQPLKLASPLPLSLYSDLVTAGDLRVPLRWCISSRTWTNGRNLGKVFAVANP